MHISFHKMPDCPFFSCDSQISKIYLAKLKSPELTRGKKYEHTVKILRNSVTTALKIFNFFFEIRSRLASNL
jgi:hypothetical protein